MIHNKIDTRRARKLEFKTHTFYVDKISRFIAVYVDINDDVYVEMQLSSRHLSCDGYINDYNRMQDERLLATVFNIVPNPDFVFKTRPIENERYLIFRYIKSIFQISNNNLIQFSNDTEFKKFCEENELEYQSQTWFNRLYLDEDYNNAIDYLIKCSLVFQDLYFPKNEPYREIPSLHDAKRLMGKAIFKKDFHEIYNILSNNNVTKLYHFTDKQNVDSIKKYGILSNDEIIKRGIYTKYASSVDSRRLDKNMGLGGFVRLSFAKCHPMMYTAMTANNLHPAIIEINPFVSLLPDVYFSNINCLRKGAEIGQHAEDLAKVKFEIIYSRKAYYDMSIEEKYYYQAEVLIKNRLGPEMITNIFIP